MGEGSNAGLAANVLGTIGTVCWCVQLLPQIWFNWRRKSTEGLPASMMLLWTICGYLFAKSLVKLKTNHVHEVSRSAIWYVSKLVQQLLVGIVVRVPQTYEGQSRNIRHNSKLECPVTMPTSNFCFIKLGYLGADITLYEVCLILKMFSHDNWE